jgi:hypothetical protein
LFLVGFLGGWWVVFVLWWVMGCVVLIGFFWAFVRFGLSYVYCLCT